MDEQIEWEKGTNAWWEKIYVKRSTITAYTNERNLKRNNWINNEWVAKVFIFSCLKGPEFIWGKTTVLISMT